MSATQALVLDTQRYGITLYNLETGGVVSSLELATQPYEMAVSPDNSTVYVCGVIGVIAYKVDDLSKASTITTETAESIDVSPSGEYLARGGKSEYGLYALPSNEQLFNNRQEARGDDCVATLRFNPTSEYLVVWVESKNMTVYSVPSMEPISVFVSHASKAVYSIAFISDHVFISGCEAIPKIWNVTDAECVKTLDGHDASVYSVAVSPEGSYCASRSFGCVRVYTTTDFTQIAEFKRGPLTVDRNITGANFLTEDTMLLGMENVAIHEWNIHTGEFHKKYDGQHAWPKILKPLRDYRMGRMFISIMNQW